MARVQFTSVNRIHDEDDVVHLSDLIYHADLCGIIQFNFCVDVEWLLSQLHPNAVNMDIQIFHGMQGLPRQMDVLQPVRRHVELHSVSMPMLYGVHHSKLMILFFEDETAQIVIHTANLEPTQWENVAQAVWRGPRMRSGGSRASQFKSDFLAYLDAYTMPYVRKLAKRLEKYDFSGIDDSQVVFVASVPGYFPPTTPKFGSKKLNASLTTDVDTVVAQISSIGAAPADFAPNFIREARADALRIVFPTVDDVRKSYDGYAAGGHIFFNTAGNSARVKQYGIYRKLMCRWNGPRCGASPHIKTYVGLKDNKVKWYLMTSANFSKQAWGFVTKSKGQYLINNYECGVLIRGDAASKQPLPYSLPLKLYGVNDEAWSPSTPHMEPDDWGRTWIPVSL